MFRTDYAVLFDDVNTELLGNAGNSKHDIPVWEHCGQVIVVNAERGLLDKVGDSANLVFE